ncbi:hypothetical protein GUJ93_ZPchr0006g42687 [Zizania palustris]|uniref:Uncharacterized protein n=1 Tax=Zizania palustris TaxID=103762 RepID=A0A8J5T1T5_ZIZPA|nr:hypothetical protein GUJ93_ZPchr0006g42687 [Zizania palustris]
MALFGVGGDVRGAAAPAPAPATHPRYVPNRGLVLKRVLRSLFCFGLPAKTRPLPHSPFLMPGGGSACAGGDGGGGGSRQKPPPPPGVHPRYVPKRGEVLKKIVRGIPGLFVFAPPLGGGGAVNDGGVRVSPAPPPGGDGAEQGSRWGLIRPLDQSNFLSGPFVR